MKFSKEYAEALIALVAFPAFKKVGIKFKSNCNDDYNFIRFDDNSIAYNDQRILLSFDIKKTEYYSYNFLLEIRNIDGHTALILDFIDSPIENHKKAAIKFTEFAAVFNNYFQELNSASKSHIPEYLQDMEA